MKNNELWQAVLGEIELSVSRASYVTWFKNTSLLKQSDELLVVGVSNVFIKQQFEHKFNDLVVGILKKNGVESKKIEYKICAITKSAEGNNETGASETYPASQESYTQSSGSITHDYRKGLNERYTFDNFVVGSGNEMAYAACRAVVENLGVKYNPLYLYGGVGIGKTHLIQAVGNAVIGTNSNARVVYISSDQFVKEFVAALRYKKSGDFADFYRAADVLIIDDVQFFAGKEKIQEEFFHTYNALHQANHQIIISSDKPPRDIPTLEERLRSRFIGGMTIDMQNPDFETRCAIVQTKAQTHGIDLPSDVTEFLATNIQTNIRELEGALNQLLAFCEMRELSPDLEIATGLLGSIKRPKHLTAKQVIERTARHYQVALDDILGPKRDKDIVVPRQVAMYILRSELHLSFPKIAKELGRKDHTTAIHSVDKIQKASALDSDIREAITNIRDRLYV